MLPGSLSEYYHYCYTQRLTSHHIYAYPFSMCLKDYGSLSLHAGRRMDTQIGELEYSYHPLSQSTSQFRLLTLVPHERHNADIHGTLRVMSMTQSQVESYEALSYVWGDPSSTATIYLDGCPIRVTNNLCVALRYLRQTSTSRTLWIDAICINQADIVERNHQVQTMSHIYSRASLVLVWLGESDIQTQEVMKVISQRGSSEPLNLEMSDPGYQGFVRIYQNPWWRRIWVIQEVLFATQDPMVGCGHMWLSWDKLGAALREFAMSLGVDDRWLRMERGLEPEVYQADSTLSTKFANWEEHWMPRLTTGKMTETFAEAVARTRGCNATDPRDQVYAIIGFVRKEDQGILPVPDYTKPTSEVYQEAMLAVFKSDKNLDFLIQAPNDRRLDLPSWCADFSKKIWDDIPDFGPDFGIENAKQAEEYVSAIIHNPQTETLQVSGKILGEVAFSNPLTVGHKPPSYRRGSSGQFRMLSRRRSMSIRGTIFRRNFPTRGTIIRRRSYSSHPNYDKFSYFLNNVLVFTYIAFIGFRLRLGQEEALKRIAAGDVWKTIGQGKPLHHWQYLARVKAGITIDKRKTQ